MAAEEVRSASVASSPATNLQIPYKVSPARQIFTTSARCDAMRVSSCAKTGMPERVNCSGKGRRRRRQRDCYGLRIKCSPFASQPTRLGCAVSSPDVSVCWVETTARHDKTASSHCSLIEVGLMFSVPLNTLFNSIRLNQTAKVHLHIKVISTTKLYVEKFVVF